MSPAGNKDALRAAVKAGADAVYLGGRRFGARQFAGNFAPDELKAAVEFAHLRGVRIYVTVNILTADSEMPELADYLVFLYNVGVDAVIVQDLGAAALARAVTPDMPLFASTQMTVTDLSGAAFVRRHGFSRVVLARESSLADIRAICAAAGCEVEVFIHGALCVSYSGQCLMSSLIGGRSGNRGQCAQPCRLPYIMTDADSKAALPEGVAGRYLLSPRDLNAIDLIPDLIGAGVSSLKIEGRMKRPEYVAVTTEIYRRAIDGYYAGAFHVPEKDRRDLRQIFNRGFTTAYLTGRPGRELLSDRRPNNRGVPIGRVTAAARGNPYIELKLEEDLNAGDEIEIWVSAGGRAAGTVEELAVGGQAAAGARRGEVARIAFPHAVKVNDRVFRTFDQQLMSRVRGFFTAADAFSLPVAAVVRAAPGEPFTVTYSDAAGNSGAAATSFRAEPPRSRPLTAESVKKQIGRLGGTDFYLEKLDLNLTGDLMVPLSEINDARRRAIAALRQTRLDAFLRREEISTPGDAMLAERPRQPAGKPLLSVHAGEFNQLCAALEGGADIIIYGDCYNRRPAGADEYRQAARIVRKTGKEIWFAAPRLTLESDKNSLCGLIELFKEIGGGVLVSSLAAYAAARGSGLPVWINCQLNAFNALTLEFWRNEGAAGVTLSQELTLPQVEEMARKGILPIECMADGRAELMISEYCAAGVWLDGGGEKSGGRPCVEKQYFLQDRFGEQFPIVTDQLGRMRILNAKELCLLEQAARLSAAPVERLRIDARYLPAQEVRRRVADYRQAIDGKSDFAARAGTTRGHYFRGVIEQSKIHV
jgi:putative protease